MRSQLAGSDPSYASIRPPDAAAAVARFPRWAMAGGVLNALFVSLVLARWHQSFFVTGLMLFVAALSYVALAVLGAMAAARYYWNDAKFRSRFTLQELMETWGAAWVWAPAVVLWMWRDMYWAPLLTALAAALPACAMHWLRVRAERGDSVADWERPPLFAETLQSIPSDWRGAAIAIGIYATCVAYADGDSLLCCITAAVTAFLFAGRRAEALDSCAEMLISPQRARIRLACSAALAVLATMLALVPGEKREGGGAVAFVSAATKAATRPVVHGIGGPGGYQGVVLWPSKPEKQLILPPDLLPASALVKQQTLEFTGVYWYFEAPADDPGPHAHVAHGNPMDVSIRTVNSRPLVMEAHQKLARPIRLASVREIAITMRNRDNEPGLLSIGVALTDSARGDKDGVNLGLQPLASTKPEFFAMKTAPVSETLRFAVPEQARTRRFDGITVLMVPDASRMHTGARVAIERFELVPR